MLIKNHLEPTGPIVQGTGQRLPGPPPRGLLNTAPIAGGNYGSDFWAPQNQSGGGNFGSDFWAPQNQSGMDVNSLMPSAAQMGPTTSYVDPDYFNNNDIKVPVAGQFNNAAPVNDSPYYIPLPGLGAPSSDFTPGVFPVAPPSGAGGFDGITTTPVVDPNPTPEQGAVSDPVFQSGPGSTMIYPHAPFPDMGGMPDFNQMALDAAGIQPAMQRNIQFAGPQNRMLDEMLAAERERAAQTGGTPEWIESLGDGVGGLLGGPMTWTSGLFGGVGDFFEGLF